MSINQAKDGMSSCKGFFNISLDQIDKIIHSGGSSEEVIVYLVIARGIGKHGYSTWGVNACANYTLMTYHRAKKCVEWLLANDFIAKHPDHMDKASQSRPKFLIKQGGSEIALANALIEGIAQGKKTRP